MTTGAFGQNVDDLFFKLKLVPDNLFIYAEGNREATERKTKPFSVKTVGDRVNFKEGKRHCNLSPRTTIFVILPYGQQGNEQ